jgi:hypothetical protein
MPATWKKLAYSDDVVEKTLFSSANSIIAAVTANAPAVLAIAADGIVGRLSTAAIASLTPANVRTIINVEDGAQACNATRVNAAGAIMETDIAAKGDLIVGNAANSFVILPVGAQGKILKVGAANLVGWDTDSGGGFPNTANATTRAALTPALGDVCFQVDTLEPYICTVIA